MKFLFGLDSLLWLSKVSGPELMRVPHNSLTRTLLAAWAGIVSISTSDAWMIVVVGMGHTHPMQTKAAHQGQLSSMGNLKASREITVLEKIFSTVAWFNAFRNGTNVDWSFIPLNWRLFIRIHMKISISCHILPIFIYWLIKGKNPSINYRCRSKISFKELSECPLWRIRNNLLEISK